MGSLIIPTTSVKILKSDGYLISVVGDGVLTQKVARVISVQGHEVGVLESISDMYDDSKHDGIMLAVSYDRRLILIDNNGLRTELDQVNFWAIGCADQLVLGRLLHLAETREITVDDAVEAIKASAKYDSSIDDRVQIFHLNAV